MVPWKDGRIQKAQVCGFHLGIRDAEDYNWEDPAQKTSRKIRQTTLKLYYFYPLLPLLVSGLTQPNKLKALFTYEAAAF